MPDFTNPSRIKKSVRIFFLIFLFPVVFLSTPQRSHAYLGVADIVVDPTNLVQNTISAVADSKGIIKDFVLDGIAWRIGNMMIERLTAQTVNWVNSGFQGNPAYVTDPGRFFLNVGDTVAADFLSSTKFEAVCSPFRAEIRLALVKNHLAETDNRNYSCTLSKVRDNYDAFMQDFGQGGWEGWFEVTQVNANNPYGAYLEAKDAMAVNINAQVGKYKTQLDQGNGFLSYERCKPGTGLTITNRMDITGPEVTNEEAYAQCLTDNGGPESETALIICDATLYRQTGPKESSSYPKGTTTSCAPAHRETVTPGSVIQEQLNKALGSGGDRLKVSNSINQIVSALLTQLITKVVGGGSKDGLRGASVTPPPTSQVQILLDQLNQKTTVLAPDPDAPLPSEESAAAQAEQAIQAGGTADTTSTPETEAATTTPPEL